MYRKFPEFYNFFNTETALHRFSIIHKKISDMQPFLGNVKGTVN